MKLEINGGEVDFRIEHEKTLGEVYSAVVKHLRDLGMSGIELKMDGMPINLVDDAWRKIPPEAVGVLSVSCQSILEINTCIEAVILAKEAVSSRSESSIAKISAIWPSFCDSLSFWLEDLNLAPDFFVALSELNRPFGDQDEERRAHATRLLSIAHRVLIEKDKELENPKKEALQAIETLIKSQEAFIKLSLDFQAGRDSAAMREILSFMEAFQKFIRCISFLEDGSDMDAIKRDSVNLAADISGFMNELTVACERGDYVLAGDLAEYEVAGRLEKLKPIKQALSMPESLK